MEGQHVRTMDHPEAQKRDSTSATNSQVATEAEAEEEKSKNCPHKSDSAEGTDQKDQSHHNPNG